MDNQGVVEKRLSYHDSWWSWTVAAACGWCFFWVVIVNRCGGIIYVSMVAELGGSREAASWPILLLSCVSLLMGAYRVDLLVPCLKNNPLKCICIFVREYWKVEGFAINVFLCNLTRVAREAEFLD